MTAPTSDPAIVAGFDDSPSGFDAVALGRQLAEATGARLVVAHVYHDGTPAVSELPRDPVLVERVRGEAAERLAGAAPALGRFESWTGVLHEAVSAARGLHEVAEHHAAELIVTGSTHRHGPGRVIPGSTAERLLHASTYPVAIAPAGWHERHRGTLAAIAAGFDGSDESGSALAAAAALALAAGGSVRAVAVLEPPNPANPLFAVTSHGYGEIVHDLHAALTRRLDDAIGALPFAARASGVVIDGDPVSVLAAQSASVDLLAIGSRGYGPLRTVMAGSVGRALAEQCRCPLLVVPRGVERPLHALLPEHDGAAR
jgi:nucleotide-binding universal stress UspA family protein